VVDVSELATVLDSMNNHEKLALHILDNATAGWAWARRAVGWPCTVFRFLVKVYALTEGEGL